MRTLNIAAWNILSDQGGYYNTEPQVERQESIIHTLSSQGMQFDIVGLLEVENNDGSSHHGQSIAQNLAGVDGHWAKMPTTDEYLGLFGKEINAASSHSLAGNRLVITTHIGELAIGLVHFTYSATSDRLRTKQAKQTIDHMANYDKAVLMGDFNSASWQRSRRVIEAAGFQSVFQALGRKRPPTILTEKYRQRLSLKYRLATKRGFSPDDIYVRGLGVEDAGVFEGDSDHRGVWAQVKF